MMRTTLSMTLAALALVALSVQPADARTIKIAYVDIGKLVDQSERVKGIIEPLRQQYENDSRNITAERESLQARIKELERSAESRPDDTEILRQREDLVAKVATFAEETREKAKEFEKQQADKLRPLILAVEDELKKYGQEQGLDFIFRKQDVPYMNPKYDITDTIIQRIDRNVRASGGGQ